MLGFNYLVWVGIVSWVVFPLTAFFVARLLWRRSQTDLSRLLALVAGVAILFTPAAISNARKTYYDRQVRALCAKEGGVRLYDKVTLDAEKINKWGQPNFYEPTERENALGSDYLLEKDRHFYKRGSLGITRTQYRVIRRSDGKLLGEEVFYGRVGGDLPGPWQHSSFHCPSDYGVIPLLKNVFNKPGEQ
jgi:hypothetical protein